MRSIGASPKSNPLSSDAPMAKSSTRQSRSLSYAL